MLWNNKVADAVQKRTHDLLDIVKAGQDARLKGLTLDDNPYCILSERPFMFMWDKGWKAEDWAQATNPDMALDVIAPKVTH
ncbi:hypothetical protein [Ruegeria hyattellae]|jgi:hypothetical protein|uniref:hypothetical protein n=1 Tax=Ruegeria hyattellae TaxID=3233337 RepID=UPI00355C3695